MRKKKIPDIYIRQYTALEKKHPAVRKSFVFALIVIIVIAVGITLYINKDRWIKKPLPVVTVTQKESISVYFDAGQGKLIEKKIEITGAPADKEKGEAIIRNLKTLKIVPAELMLNDLVIDSDGILYLNFSKDLPGKGTTAMTEILQTFSIVNSFLGTFRNANKVQFLVEGQPVYTFNGTVYTYKPLEFNKDLLED